jgi:hypothetical protein
MVLYVLTVLGGAFFAVSGALRAEQKGMDFFGVLVIAAITATGGGTIYGDEQRSGDLPVGFAGGDEREHLQLAFAQGLRKSGTGRRGAGSVVFERR